MGNVWLTKPYLNNGITLTSMGLPRDRVGHMNYKPEELKRIIRAYAAKGHQMSLKAAEIFKAPDVRERLKTLGVEPTTSTPEEFAKFCQSEMKRWSDLVKETGAVAH
jgi:tripartite-type tricarboxylate transporter receptor subunit TctC